jgi:glycosyltransferase involved in cell wall biosynthesis
MIDSLRFVGKSGLETEPGGYIRLGLLLNESEIPAKPARDVFFSQFGHQHCFISKSEEEKFIVFSSSHTEKLSFESLPIDYLYAPDSWTRRLSDDHIRNVLLSLSHLKNDFLIVSASLSLSPCIEVSSLKNNTVFSKEQGLDFLEGVSLKPATGRVPRLLPYEYPVVEVNVEHVFKDRSATWLPDNSWVSLNGAAPALPRPIPDNELTATSFIPRFIKQKPLVFVWPIFIAVGGAERNAIEVMKHLKDRFHLVVITMERPYENQGSLHHQLKGIATAMYDLGELASWDSYLEMLKDLKAVYEPDAIWACNGSPWFCDNAANLRQLFDDTPIIDQEVYDTDRGWILRYHEPGIQSFDRFIAINQRIYDTFIDRLRMDPSRIDLIYHAIDAHRFDPSRYDPQDRQTIFRKFDLPEDRPLFLLVGRLYFQKRPLDFLQLALRRLQSKDNALFVVVGDGEMAGEVNSYVAEHQLTNVRLIPFVENMAELFSIASGMIMTSAWEGLPVVFLEALSMGLPVLSTDVGDIKLMLDQYEAGLIIPEIGNIEVLEKCYEDWTNDLPRYKATAQSNSSTVRSRFSGETVAQQYAASWDQAIRDKPASKRKSKRSRTLTTNTTTGLVSVIIPSYNHAEYLPYAIGSVLTQSYQNIELIVIDDGSIDFSVNYLKEFDDPRYSFVCQENQGAHAAINRGLQMASGEYLTILNSDDVFHPNRIQNLIAEFQNDSEVELLSTWIEVIDATGKQLAIKQGWHNLEPWPIAHPELSFKQTDDFFLNLLMGNFVATTSNIMMRRALYNKIGGMRHLRFAHDWDFLLRAAAGARCKLVPEPLIKYRVHDSNTISSDRAWMLFEICWVLAANLHRVQGKQIFNKAEPEKYLKDIETIYESINLQGNDKVFWVMRALIDSLKSGGVENPEELLLEDKDLREKLIGYIQV